MQVRQLTARWQREDQILGGGGSNGSGMDGFNSSIAELTKDERLEAIDR
jgi:hypothetical protein